MRIRPHRAIAVLFSAVIATASAPLAHAFYERALDANRCTVCLDDCPRRGLAYGEYFCYDAQGDIDRENAHARPRRETLSPYIMTHRNDKTYDETTLRRRFVHPHAPRSDRIAASDPTNGRGRLSVNRQTQKRYTAKLDKTARTYLRGTEVSGYRRTKSQGETVRIEQVIDGQTFEVSPREGERFTVELAGITVPSDREGRCFGETALAGVSLMLNGKNVLFRPNSHAVDESYGHVSGYIDLDGSDVGGLLLQAGYAIIDPARTHDFEEEYAGFEREGRLSKSGLWSACTVESVDRR